MSIFNMEPPWLPTAAVLLGIAGPISHYAFWMRHEFDGVFQKYLPLIFLSQAASFLLFIRFLDLEVLQAAVALSLLQTSYVVSLFTSIAIYRLFLHSTGRFAGPFWARLSTWWRVKSCFLYEGIASKSFAVTDQLHGQYGDVVRVGPRHLSINHVEAVAALYGSESVSTKSANYTMGLQRHLEAIRDYEEHHHRRTMWDKGLNAKACQEFMPRLDRITNRFIEKIREHGGEPICINDWCHFVTFDVMGDLGFGRDYGQLESGKMHPVIKAISEFGKYGVAGWHVPWLINIVQSIPGVEAPDAVLKNIAEKSLDERIKEEPDSPDVLSYVLNSGKGSRWPFDKKTMVGDVFLLQFAGSDTSYSVMVMMFYYLAKHTEYQTRLREEVKPAVPPEGPPTWSILNALPLLNGIIQETLRLHPPVPSGMGREIPKQGAQIGPYWVPGETVATVPTWTIQRDERYWVLSNEWIPERWFSRPELIKNCSAFVPFSIGPYNCAGKYFAVMELKVFMAKVVAAFGVSFAPGEDGRDVVENQRDYLTLSLPDMRLCLVPRNGS